MFTIDGSAWPYPCSVTRNADMRASEVSGEMLDGSYYNDVLGTYMSYTIRVAGPLNRRDALATLYEALTEPVEGHTFVLPYNSGNIVIAGRVDGSVSDVFVRLAGGEQYWKGLQFTVISNHASRALTGAQIISRGRAPMPEPAIHAEGDTWVWTNGAWAQTVHYDDADVKRY